MQRPKDCVIGKGRLEILNCETRGGKNGEEDYSIDKKRWEDARTKEETMRSGSPTAAAPPVRVHRPPPLLPPLSNSESGFWTRDSINVELNEQLSD